MLKSLWKSRGRRILNLHDDAHNRGYGKEHEHYCSQIAHYEAS